MVFIVSKFEEDVLVDEKVLHDYFMEMGYLFFEAENEKKFLLGRV
jgi:hypothetical protein